MFEEGKNKPGLAVTENRNRFIGIPYEIIRKNGAFPPRRGQVVVEWEEGWNKGVTPIAHAYRHALLEMNFDPGEEVLKLIVWGPFPTDMVLSTDSPRLREHAQNDQEKATK